MRPIIIPTVQHACLRLASARFTLNSRLLPLLPSVFASQYNARQMTSSATAAAGGQAEDVPSDAPLQQSDLAQLDGHTARCVGSMLSAMVGDVLGELVKHVLYPWVNSQLLIYGTNSWHST